MICGFGISCQYSLFFILHFIYRESYIKFKVITQSVRYIRIHHECEGRIEKSVPRIAVWHHEACRVMPNGDPEGRIFLSYPHTNNGLFFLLTAVFIYSFIFKIPEYSKMQFQMMTLLDVLGNIALVR